eukprot:2511112-Karenia_brevis.AAC.1
MVPLQEGQCAVCGCVFSAISSPFCVGMKTGPSHQDLLIVKAVVPHHKDLATIQMFKMYTNASKKCILWRHTA